MDELPEAIRPLIESFSGAVFCHAPGDRPFDLEALAHPAEPDDRWSTPGAATAYLASDPAVALAEYGRHRPGETGPATRRLVRLDAIGLDVLDLRRPAVTAALGEPEEPHVWLDRERACDAARRIRDAAICQALIVPSMAFLDRRDAFNLVVFREAITGPLDEALREAVDIGRIELRGAGTSGGADASGGARGAVPGDPAG